MCVMSGGGDGVMQGDQFCANSEYMYKQWAAVIFHEVAGLVGPGLWRRSLLQNNTVDSELL